MVRFCIAFLLLASTAFGQIKVDITAGYRTQFPKDAVVRVLPDGSVLSSVAPLGILPQGTITIAGVKTAILRAYDQSTGKRVAIEETAPMTYAWTSPKVISVEITYADDMGLLRAYDADNITLPDDPAPTPTPAPIANDPELVKGTKAAFVKLVNSMANDFDTTATNLKAGKYKTLVDAAADSKARDLLTQNAFKASLAELMKPRLGDMLIPKNADLIFNDLATGAREAVK